MGYTKEEFDTYIKSLKIEYSYYGSIESYCDINRPIHSGLK